MLLLIKQRYNSESNSQLDVVMFADNEVVAYQAKIQFRKQFTTKVLTHIYLAKLLLIKQRYNSESNSQPSYADGFNNEVVAYQAKIQFRKQFTTAM